MLQGWLIVFQEEVNMKKKGSNNGDGSYDLQPVKDAMTHGMFVCGILATINIGLATVHLIGFKLLNTYAVFYGIFFLIFWLGIYKKSRVITILSFAIYIIDRIVSFVYDINYLGAGIILSIFLALGLITSIRGVIYYHILRKSHIIKKNVVILNLLAVMYSIIAIFLVAFPVAYFLPNQFLEVVDRGWFVQDERIAVGLCTFAIIYILSLMKVLPFTKKRQTVYYEISEENLKYGETDNDKNRELHKSLLHVGRIDGC
jgi:hypothetical protein